MQHTPLCRRCAAHGSVGGAATSHWCRCQQAAVVRRSVQAASCCNAMESCIYSKYDAPQLSRRQQESPRPHPCGCVLVWVASSWPARCARCTTSQLPSSRPRGQQVVSLWGRGSMGASLSGGSDPQAVGCGWATASLHLPRHWDAAAVRVARPGCNDCMLIGCLPGAG